MKLRPDETTLEKLLSGISTKYLVPEYQRDYSWKVENIDELWSDIRISCASSTDYFMGPIVLNAEGHTVSLQ